MGEERGFLNVENIVLQPESIKNYFKNPDSTWTYLVHWKDIWLHESLCVSFTNLIEEFWKNEETPITEDDINKFQATNTTGMQGSCNIQCNDTCNIPGDKMCVISNNDVFNMADNNCNETEFNHLTATSITELSCNNQEMIDNAGDESQLGDIANCEDDGVELNSVKSKDSLKEIIIGVAFEQALSGLDETSRNDLMQSFNEVPVRANMENDVITNTLNYHMTNEPLQGIGNQMSQEIQLYKIEASGQKIPKTSRSNPMECETCHKILSSRNSLREHRITVHLKNGRFPCEDCGKRFTHQRALRLHRVMHTKDRNFICHICNSSHKRRRELELHMRDMHSTMQNYRCDVCFKCFKMKGLLKDHCFSEHETTVTNCIVCKQKLTTPFSIYTHCLKHAEPREYKCTMSMCNREFKSKAQLKKHITVHDPEKRPYKQCPKCFKLIYSRSHYYEHVNSHDNDTNEIVRSKCNQCDASFQHSSSLKRHRIRHRPGGDLEYPKHNPYIDMDENLLPDLCCKSCRKLYTSKSGYYEHIKRCCNGVSSEELCLYCNKVYSSRKTLNRHIRNKHPVEWAALQALYNKDESFNNLEGIQSDLPVHVVTDLHSATNDTVITSEMTQPNIPLEEKAIYS